MIIAHASRYVYDDVLNRRSQLTNQHSYLLSKLVKKLDSGWINKINLNCAYSLECVYRLRKCISTTLCFVASLLLLPVPTHFSRPLTDYVFYEDTTTTTTVTG